MSIVTVFVSTSAENVGAERRFDKGITIEQLKIKLEPITGIPANTQCLSLYNGETLIGSLDGDDSLMLGAFPIENYMRLHVVDTNPNRVRNQYTDVSLVDKYEMPDEEYSKRSDSVLAFKQRNKFGRFADGASLASEASFEEEAKDIKVGDRCEVDTGDEDGLRRRGTVQFVERLAQKGSSFFCTGLTKFKPGYWVGIQYDEPLGKNDGSVDGERYFTAPPKYGAFVRPNKVRVGDYPEENLEDELEEM